ncbi:MAG: class I SAM-dependent methyltransferase [Pseudomonadota bacterium]
MSTVVSPLENRLIEALQSDRLPTVLEAIRSEPVADLTATEQLQLERVEAALKAQRARCRAAGETLETLLESADIAARFDADELESSTRAYALITLKVRPQEATRAQRLLIKAGFLGVRPDHNPAWEVTWRFGRRTLLVRTDDDYLRVLLRWHDSDWQPRFGRLAPTPDDVRRLPAIALLWPLGVLLKPLRVLARRFGWLREPDSFAPFMGTPRALLDPLLDFAQVGPEDRLLDLGCGDATLLLHAVATRNCRAIGYELDADAFARAQQNCSSSTDADRIALHQADARTAALAGVTVIFLFLPATALEDLVPLLLERADPGTRIVAHEQTALPATLEPQQRRLLVAEDIMTVAYRWVC